MKFLLRHQNLRVKKQKKIFSNVKWVINSIGCTIRYQGWTISTDMLQTKSAQYVTGAVNVNEFKSILESIFGESLSQVVPIINASLPTDNDCRETGGPLLVYC